MVMVKKPVVLYKKCTSTFLYTAATIASESASNFRKK